MIPENQTWQKAGDTVYLTKNHGSGDSGYYVDVQGSQEMMGALKKKLDGFNKVICQWNPVGLPEKGKVLTVREVSQDFKGNAILELVRAELRKLGYTQINKHM